MKRFITLLSILSLTSVLFAQEKTVVRKERKDLPAKHYQDGTKLYKSGSYGRAISEYDKAYSLLKNYSSNKEKIHSRYEDEAQRKKIMVYAALGSARAAGKMGGSKKATEYFNRALDIDKSDAKSWISYGKFLTKRPNKTEAKNALLNAVKYAEEDFSNPNSKVVKRAKSIASEAYYQLGKLTQSRDQRKAVQYYTKSIEFDDDGYQPYLYLGNLYQKMKKYGDMKNTFTKLESLLAKLNKVSRYKRVVRKQMPTVKYKLGVALYETKRYNESIKKLGESVKTAKSAEKNASFYYLGLNYKRLQQKNQALKEFKKVKKGPFKESANYEIDLITKYKQ